MKINYWLCMVGGDQNAFLTIYQNHYQALFCYGISITTDKELTKDCIQELFMEIWKTRRTLNGKVKNIRAYLFTWLRRKIFHELSRKTGERNNNISFENTLSNILPYEDLLIAFQQSEEDKSNLHAALKKLSRGQLEVIRLKFFDNLSYAQIAVKTSLSIRSARLRSSSVTSCSCSRRSLSRTKSVTSSTR